MTSLLPNKHWALTTETRYSSIYSIFQQAYFTTFAVPGIDVRYMSDVMLSVLSVSVSFIPNYTCLHFLIYFERKFNTS